MKPLIVLICVFTISCFGIRIFYDRYDIALAGRIAMSAMLVFTAIGHFVYTKGMSLMLPVYIPYRIPIIYITGILEVVLTIGLLVPDVRILSGWVLIVFLILILPANIYAAVRGLDYQTAKFDGNGLNYLYLRIPMQILFIFWTYFCTIKG